MSSIQTPILIIGAGPAGATTSLFLSKMQVPHLIVDAAVFPRDKVCGDGLDLKVVRVLRHLDEAIVQDEIPQHPHFQAAGGTRFIMQNGRQVDFEYQTPAGVPKPLFWCAKRLHFDHFLSSKIKSAYADFRQGVKVLDIKREGQRWLVQAQDPDGNSLEIQADMLVGADGDHSVLLRHLNARKIDRRHYAATLRQYWRGVEGLHPNQLIEVYFPKGLPMSYFYIFPLPNGEANVGYGMVSSIVAKGGYNLKNVFEKLLATDPHIAPRFQHAEALETPVGWGLPLASRKREAHGEGWLLVGDAASLVCPTSGEGIGTGMMSGYIAAHFLARAWKKAQYDVSMFVHYDREIYRRLHDEIRLYNWMMRLSPRVYDFGLNLLAPNPLFQRAFRNMAPQWLQTAYETPIEVRMD